MRDQNVCFQCLDETVLMMGHMEIRKIIPKLSQLPILIWSTDYVMATYSGPQELWEHPEREPPEVQKALEETSKHFFDMIIRARKLKFHLLSH